MLSEGQRLYRDLPWRDLDDPYAVLVSEIMLQQTQVKRAWGGLGALDGHVPYARRAGAAPPADVLAEWQGLGYNRRALALKRAADQCSQRIGGRLPETVEELQELPGIGPATAAGVIAFARNLPAIYIETNVRTVFIHTLFPGSRSACRISELEPLVAACCPEDGPGSPVVLRAVGVGAHLKSQVGNASRRSAHYTRQSAFEGSRRQKRAEAGAHRAGDARASPSSRRRCAWTPRSAQAAGQRRPAAVRGICADLGREGFFRQEDGRLFP